MGQQLQDEAKKTIDICYNQAQNVRPITRQDIRETRRRYLLFARQVYDRNVKLSSAGFFPIDHSLIFHFSTFVCTYVIVVCQLVTNSKS